VDILLVRSNDMTIRRNYEAAIYPAVLAILNAWLCAGLFRIEYSRFLGSIESSYIAIARWSQMNWGDLTWWPLWYGGVPWENTYPPLLHWTVAAVAQLAGLSSARAYHIVVALFFCAGPVTLYGLALRLSRSLFASFIAGLVYSLASASAILIRPIRVDLGGMLLPQRLHVLVAYGEGPHIASLALLPLAVLALDRALERRTAGRVLWAALALGAVVLTNLIGAFALATAIFALLLTRADWFDRRSLRLIVNAALIGVLGWLLVAFWLPPSVLSTVSNNARYIEGDYRGAYAVLPIFFALAGGVCLLLRSILRRLGMSPALQFFALWSVLAGGVVLGRYWLNQSVVPQPHRYQLEMDMAFAATAVFALCAVAFRFSRRVKTAIAAVVLIAIAPLAYHEKRWAHGQIAPLEIARTSEYRIARWFDAHRNGARVFAPGNVSFWMNVFSGVPQVGGGVDQARLTNINLIANYFIYSGDGGGDHDAEYSILWLKASGARMVAVTGPRSTEMYHPFRNAAKFNGVLPELWRDGDDVIYDIPGPNPSLAHVVSRAELVSRAPADGIDVEPLRPYVAALGDVSRPLATMTWLNNHQVRIAANASAGQLLSLQMNWVPGWHANVNGSARPIWADALGFIVVDPGCAGLCNVDLVYDGGTEMKVARWLSLLTLAGLLGVCLWSSRRRVRN